MPKTRYELIVETAMRLYVTYQTAEVATESGSTITDAWNHAEAFFDGCPIWVDDYFDELLLAKEGK